MGRTGARIRKLELDNETLLKIISEHIVSSSNISHRLDGYAVLFKTLINDTSTATDNGRILQRDIAFLNKKLDEIECSVTALRAEQEHVRRGLWRRFCARVRLFLRR